MDFDWVLIGVGFFGLVCAVVQLVRWGAGFEKGMQEGDE